MSLPPDLPFRGVPPFPLHWYPLTETGNLKKAERGAAPTPYLRPHPRGPHLMLTANLYGEVGTTVLTVPTVRGRDQGLERAT